MKNVILTLLIVCLAIAGLITPALGEEMATEEEGVQTAEEVMAVQKVDHIVPSEDDLLLSVDKSDRVFTRLENTKLKIVSYFHRRKIGEAIVEKDFIRYQFNTDTGEVIEKTIRWREGLPEKVIPVTTREQAEAMVEGEVTSSHLFIISPESEIFRIKPTPKNPCWVVKSIDGDRRILTVIDAMTGEKLGYGIPAPYEGFSLAGPNHGSCAPYYTAYAQNAEDWFETMGYNTEMVDCPNDAKVQSHIQSDSTAMFYELAHGDSNDFRNECYNDGKILASQVDTWIGSYATMGFAFIGSCGGMCDTGDDTFSYEFRKGSSIDSVTVGYCEMGSDYLCEFDCWPDAIAWQTELFTWMNNGYTVGYAYYRANLAYPDCTDDDHYCMRIAGDTNLRFAGTYDGKNIPEARRSKCGAIYNAWPFYSSPLPAVASRTYTRAHHIRCNSYVPAGDYYLTIDTSSSYPYNEVAFVNNSKLTVNGAYLSADGGSGEISFVSAQDRNKGMKFSGEFKMYTGGQIKIYE